MTVHLPERLATQIHVNPETGCWEWQGAVDKDGYGRVRWDGKSWQPVHRVVYKLLVGPVPDDRPQLDHVKARGCRSRACCWPEHLEPVTSAENTRRGLGNHRNAVKTHCKRGHEFTPENTGPNKQRDGSKVSRRCLTCHRNRQRERDRAKAATS